MSSSTSHGRVEDELFELQGISSTIDKILATLDRVNRMIVPGGALFEAHKQYEEALMLDLREESRKRAFLEQAEEEAPKKRRRGRPRKGT